MSVLGVVMAGGRNTRYGGLKAFADVGGAPIVERAIGALRLATDDVVLIANDIEAYAALGLPTRADEVASGAPLAGLLTALRWSVERGHQGAAVVACDMPFASAELMRELVSVSAARGADLVAPESGGRRGIEPLFAYYSSRCIAAIEAAIARNDLRTVAFYDDVHAVRVPLDVVRRFGDPEVLFMNINTMDELTVARQMATAQHS